MNEDGRFTGEFKKVGHAPLDPERLKKLKKKEPEPHTQKEEPEQITCGQGRFL